MRAGHPPIGGDISNGRGHLKDKERKERARDVHMLIYIERENWVMRE